jgi:hypothetical protein
VIAEPSRIVPGSRDVAAVESRIRDVPLSEEALPVMRLAVPPGVTPSRLTVFWAEEDTRTREPFPLPGVASEPRVIEPIGRLPLAVIAEFSPRIRLSLAVRMMSLPIRGTPSLSRVRFSVEVETVMLPWLWVRTPPMSSESAPKLFKSEEERARIPGAPPVPVVLIRMSTGLLMSMSAPRAEAGVVAATAPAMEKFVEAVYERIPASIGRRGTGISREVATSVKNLLAVNSWYSARWRKVLAEATSKEPMLVGPLRLGSRLLARYPETMEERSAFVEGLAGLPVRGVTRNAPGRSA